MIESIATPDDRTVRITLEYPYPAFEHSLTQAIVPKSVRESGKEQFAKEPVGSGPFEIRSFAEEKKAKVVRWPEYWGEPKPEIAKVTAIHQESPITRAMSLVTGRNRVIEPVSPRVRSLIDERGGASIQTKPGFTSYYVGFNLNEGPTTDPDVRKAIDYCLDMDQAVEDFLDPMGNRQYSPLPERMAKQWDMPLSEWRDIPLGRNTEEAKLLFEEVGLDKEIEILVPKDPKRMEIGRRLATGIREAGYRASVSPTAWKSFLEKRVSGVPSDYMVFIDGIHGGPDPDFFTYQLFHRDQEGKTNGVFYDNNEVMNQLERARRTTDRGRRRRLYESALTTILRERVVLPAYSYRNSFAIKNNVRNFRVHPNAQLNPRVVSPDRTLRISEDDFLGSSGGGGGSGSSGGSGGGGGSR
jgi:peptide/nickel transport system substrate-binding protein